MRTERQMSPTLDLSKPVQTRDGRKVRILCTDRRGPAPVIGLVECASSEALLLWSKDGKFSDYISPSDLVNVPEPERTGWLVVGGAGAYLYKTRETAAHCFRGLEHDAIVEVKYRPGQGIEI